MLIIIFDIDIIDIKVDNFDIMLIITIIFIATFIIIIEFIIVFKLLVIFIFLIVLGAIVNYYFTMIDFNFDLLIIIICYHPIITVNYYILYKIY